jgi:chloride channel protein, CIC family
MFGIEVLYLGSVSYAVLYPSFVAGIVGYQVATGLGIRYFHELLATVPRPTQGIFLATALAGVVFGLVALLLIEMLAGLHRLFGKVPGPPPLRALVGGSVVAFLALAVSPRYLGLGVDTIEASLQGAHVPLLAFFWKTLFTSISLGTGGSGGIVTPIFFVGATAGSAFGHLLHLDPAVFAGIGMVAVLAGAANTPLSASIMAIELFGTSVAPLAAIACIVSFLMVGHRSVYPSQVVAIVKSSSVRLTTGVEVGSFGDLQFRPWRFRRVALFRRVMARRRWRAMRVSDGWSPRRRMP